MNIEGNQSNFKLLKVETAKPTKAAVLSERAYLYKFFSLLFMYPTEKTLEELKKVISQKDINLKTDNKQLMNLLNSLMNITTSEWQEIYTKTFGHITADIPLYESNYFPDNVFKESQRLADIGAFYKAFGLKIAADTKEKLDHISLELEFMHYLLSKEMYAVENNNIEHQEICQDAQQKFFTDHLSKWATKFCQRLQQYSHHILYNNVANLLQSFIQQEIETIHSYFKP